MIKILFVYNNSYFSCYFIEICEGIKKVSSLNTKTLTRKSGNEEQINLLKDFKLSSFKLQEAKCMFYWLISCSVSLIEKIRTLISYHII